MKKASAVFLQCSLICVLPAFFADAVEVNPVGEQVSMKWGRVNESHGVRKVLSTEVEYNAHNRNMAPLLSTRCLSTMAHFHSLGNEICLKR